MNYTHIHEELPVCILESQNIRHGRDFSRHPVRPPCVSDKSGHVTLS